eukprot:4921574-Prymnesium_polylepis.1
MRDFFFASATGRFLLKCRKKIAEGNSGAGSCPQGAHGGPPPQFMALENVADGSALGVDQRFVQDPPKM